MQRIYRGGTQFHEHWATSPFGPMHTEAKLHDGFWRHLHDDGGQVAVEEDEEEE